MTNTALVILPNSDITTRYISAWAEQTTKDLKSKKLQFILIAKEKAAKAIFESMLKKHSPSFVFLNGHGSANSVCGQNEEPLLEVGTNEGVLKGAVTYALSCSSASVLGPKSVEAGAIAYIGYTNDFIFFISKEKVSRPKEDRTADMFLTPANHVVVSLSKGHTTSEACKTTQAYFYKNIQKLVSSETSIDDREYIRYLIWNMRNLICHGNQQAVVVN
jgi:hypothetical protein